MNWMTASLIGLIDTFPSLKPFFWQWIYNKIAENDAGGNFLFMNYGYADEKAKPLKLANLDEPNRLAIQLYAHVVDDLHLNDKDILEVGCGRGGGGSFMLRYKNPRSYTGVDFSSKAIAWCQNHHQYANARWIQAQADTIPIPEKSIDVVINVESSHCYPSMILFLKEIKRILRTGGYVGLCDIRPQSSFQTFDEAVIQAGFKVLSKKIITRQVLNALDAFSATRKQLIKTTFPALYHRAINNFAAIKNSSVYQKLSEDELVYFSYVLQN